MAFDRPIQVKSGSIDRHLTESSDRGQDAFDHLTWPPEHWFDKPLIYINSAVCAQTFHTHIVVVRMSPILSQASSHPVQESRRAVCTKLTVQQMKAIGDAVKRRHEKAQEVDRVSVGPQCPSMWCIPHSSLSADIYFVRHAFDDDAEMYYAVSFNKDNLQKDVNAGQKRPRSGSDDERTCKKPKHCKSNSFTYIYLLMFVTFVFWKSMKATINVFQPLLWRNYVALIAMHLRRSEWKIS